MNKKMKEAKESLMHTHGISKDAEDNIHVDDEMNHIQATLEKAFNDEWIACFRRKDGALYRTLLGMSLQSLQQLSGANYFFYYGATIFKAIGFSNSFVTQFIFGAVNFICTFGGMYVLERVSDSPICKSYF